MTEITFFVPGAPKTAGSKRGFPLRTGKINSRTGKEIIRVIITEDCKYSKDWRGSVVASCKEKYSGPLLSGPLRLDVMFYMQRPKNHYGTGKNANELKSGVAKYHDIRPDRGKLLRALEDALTSVLWKDDAQVCGGGVWKMYAEKPGALVTVKELRE